jgi:hypothetical protein
VRPSLRRWFHYIHTNRGIHRHGDPFVRNTAGTRFLHLRSAIDHFDGGRRRSDRHAHHQHCGEQQLYGSFSDEFRQTERLYSGNAAMAVRFAGGLGRRFPALSEAASCPEVVGYRNHLFGIGGSWSVHRLRWFKQRCAGRNLFNSSDGYPGKWKHRNGEPGGNSSITRRPTRSAAVNIPHGRIVAFKSLYSRRPHQEHSDASRGAPDTALSLVGEMNI